MLISLRDSAHFEPSCVRIGHIKHLISARALEKNCETKSFQLLGALPPDLLTRGSALDPLGAQPLDPRYPPPQS